MKKLLTILVILFVSCSSKETVKDVPVVLDTLISKSQLSIDSAVKINYKSDSTTKIFVVKKVKEISYLQNLVKAYEQKFNTIKTSEVQTIYKVDTVYIETKKNFWGKSKVSTSKKEGQPDIIDTTKTVIDTIN